MIVRKRYQVQIRVLHSSAWRDESTFRSERKALEDAEDWRDAGAYEVRVIDTKYLLN